MQILPFDPDAIARFRELCQLHRPTGRNDLKIAATVLQARDTLVTRNVADFDDITGLSIDDWSIAEK